MKNVCIVGVGLIGGSLGMSLRRVRRAGRRVYHVSGLGRSESALRRAKSLGAIDDFSRRPADVSKADIVVLAVPVSDMAALAKTVRPFLKKGAILTDVGSVKMGIVSKLKGPFFVGAHPIAGSEKTGVENATPRLFKGALCILTRDFSSKGALIAVARLWKDVGANIVVTTAAEHDRVLALTSHLPHLLAFSLFSLVRDFARGNPLAKIFAGPSFQEMTRIAAADPNVWTGIVQMNRAELSRAVKNVTTILRSLSTQPVPKLRNTLSALSRDKRAWSL
jgi:prephenate dehydrogenase